MARIRTIKPEFFTSEDIVGLSPLARLLYIGLWCESDREGRLNWKPRTLKMKYLPAESCDIAALCQELVDSNLVAPYIVDGEPYALLPSFKKHQTINSRESASSIPDPPDELHVHAREHICLHVQDDGDGKGKEGKGREGKGKEHASGDATRKRAPSKTTLPPDFGVSERVRVWAAEKGHGQLDRHLESFRAKAAANGYTYADWDAAFMEAIRGNWANLPPGSGGPENLPGGGRRAL